jgi:hypothetical protein
LNADRKQMLLELDLPSTRPNEQTSSRFVRLPVAWRVMRRVRSMVDGALAGQSDSVRQSAQLAASELMENVIKYGDDLPDGSPPVISVRLAEGVMTIASRNGVEDDQNVTKIREILQRLRGRSDTQSVYIEAIVHSMAASRQSSCLGLLRIAAEAGFALDVSYAGGVLEISAQKGTL